MEDTIAKREIDIKDDTRQALIVGRYEIIKARGSFVRLF